MFFRVNRLTPLTMRQPYGGDLWRMNKVEAWRRMHSLVLLLFPCVFLCVFYF